MINIIASMDEKRGIGKGNDLLFKIPDDLQRVKDLTLGHPIIMGRHTFESLGKKLTGRTHIVITRNNTNIEDLDYQSDVVVPNLDEAIRSARNSPGSDEIFIFGGGQVFQQAMDRGIVERLYLTVVEGNYDADTFFPNYSEFGTVVSEEEGKSGGHKYKFIDLEK